MDRAACVPHLLIILSSVFIQGINSETKPQVTVAVKAGDDACLQCPLSYSKDVLQVMWQKILPKEEVTVATCHPKNRHKLNPNFSSKIGLQTTELSNCSIIVRNVTEQDEGCYLCLFSTSSSVAYAGKACLRVYELHEPILSITKVISTEEMEVSCSATGRPAPVVTLQVKHITRTHIKTVLNPNGTVTVVRTAALSSLQMNKTLECSVTSPFGFNTKRITVPDSTLKLCLGMLFLLSVIVIGVWLLVAKSPKGSCSTFKSHDIEENTKSDTENLKGDKTPKKQCVKEENEMLRRQTPSTVKKRQSTISPLQIHEPRKLFP